MLTAVGTTYAADDVFRDRSFVLFLVKFCEWICIRLYKIYVLWCDESILFHIFIVIRLKSLKNEKEHAQLSSRGDNKFAALLREKLERTLPWCPPSGPQILHPPGLTENTISSCPLVNIFLVSNENFCFLRNEWNFLQQNFHSEADFDLDLHDPSAACLGSSGRVEV